MATIVSSAQSPASFRDKIRLFEGGRTSPVDLRRTSSKLMSSSPLLRSTDRERNMGESSRRPRGDDLRHSLKLHMGSDYPLSPRASPTLSFNTARENSRRGHEEPPPLPPKWTVITMDPVDRLGGLTMGEKGTRREASEADITEENVVPPRLSVQDKPPQRIPQERNYEEEVIKLKRMTPEEKEMVKGLVKLTKQKNKAMDSREANYQRERDALLTQAESDKAALSAKLLLLDADLATKSRELTMEVMRSLDLHDRILLLERERQEIHAALTATKRESYQVKQKYDAELTKKTQSLLDVTAQFNSLNGMRQSMNCVICEEKVAIAVLDPCHHMVLCGPCSHKVSKCPMCRVDISRKFEIFHNWVL